MGVKGLWGVLEPAQEITTLATLADSQFRNSPNLRGFRLGVDAPLWMFHANESVGKMDVRRVGPHAALRTLFFRLCALLRKGVLSVFVFDGPGGPTWKRGRNTGQTKGAVTELERGFTALLARMGIDWRKAPGEAEAELAHMAKAGLIDAVLTDDGDSLIFGAPKILRNSSTVLAGYKPASSTAYTPRPSSTISSSQLQPSASNAAATATSSSSKHAVTTYSLTKIRNRLGFGQDDLLLVALLSGADYVPTGLPGLGVIPTIALVSHGFATQLLSGLHQLRHRSDEERAAFLGEWREAVAQVLERDVEGMMGSRQVGLARMVREARGFPDLRVVEAYLNPMVTAPAEMRAPKFDGEPDLKRVVRWCVDQLMWNEEETSTHLRNLLWKGLAMRHLRLSALAIDRSIPRSIAPGTSAILARIDAAATVSRRPERITTRTMIVAVHESKKADSTEGVASYRVELNPTVFEGLINPHFQIDEVSTSPSCSAQSTGGDSSLEPAPSPPVFWPAFEDRTASTAGSSKQPRRTGPCHWFSRSFLDLGRDEVREMVEAWEARVRDKEAGKIGGDKVRGGAGSTGNVAEVAPSRSSVERKRGVNRSVGSQSSAGRRGKENGKPTACSATIDIATIDSDDEDYLPSRPSFDNSLHTNSPTQSRRPLSVFRAARRPRLPTPPESPVLEQAMNPQTIVIDDSDEERRRQRKRRKAGTGLACGGGRASGGGVLEVVALTEE